MRQLVRVFIAPPPFDAGTREGLAQSAGDHGAAHSARAGPLRAFNCRPNRRISTPGVGRVTFAFATRCAAGGLARPTLAPKKCAAYELAVEHNNPSGQRDLVRCADLQAGEEGHVERLETEHPEVYRSAGVPLAPSKISAAPRAPASATGPTSNPSSSGVVCRMFSKALKRAV
jgi:hypothetical protein